MAGLVTGLQKFAGGKIRSRSSSPKLQVLNTALLTAQAQFSYEQALADPVFLGRLTESAVGAHLLNDGAAAGIKVYYWREQNREVDFVLELRGESVAIEVKSGRRQGRETTLSGMEAFTRAFAPRKVLLVGSGGINLEEFLQIPPRTWFD